MASPERPAADLALPSVSVVIPTSGTRPGLLQQSLQAVLGNPGVNEAIIVIDRDSSETHELRDVLRPYII